MKSKLGEWEAVFIHNRGNEYYTPGSPQKTKTKIYHVYYTKCLPLCLYKILK